MPLHVGHPFTRVSERVLASCMSVDMMCEGSFTATSFTATANLRGRYDYFGERALVKNEPRYASVRAKTKLFFLTISQSQFEFAFGSSLMELLPDKY